MDSARGDSPAGSEVLKKPQRLLLTSGAESDEWIAGRNRDPNARVPDTSGSEMPNVEEDQPNIYEDILEELLTQRAKAGSPVVCPDKRRQ